jgi:chorismate dehydratase
MNLIRLGIVPYINVLPLLEGLDEHFDPAGWVRGTPRQLAGLLAQGRLDVAMLPIFEALRAPGYRIVPECAIACDGLVRSVALFSTVPLPEIRRVLLDRASLTSVHLFQILAADLLGIAPEQQTSETPLTPDTDWAAAGFDAAVAIGDTALEWEGRCPYGLDLGAGWKDLTGLPFVFAGWVARPGVELTAADLAAFANARSLGEQRVYDIARRLAGADEARVLSLVDYLSRAIHYRLGDAHLAAIDAFRQRLIAHSLLPASTPRLDVVTPASALS